MAALALRHEVGRVGVVQVVQDHHRRVLRAAQEVVLVVVELAQLQEGLARVKVVDGLLGLGVGVIDRSQRLVRLLEHHLIASVADPGYRHEGTGDSCHLEG